MWRVLFVLVVLAANVECYRPQKASTPGRNQRIIKVQGPPHFNHFHGHHKRRPYGGGHHKDEFVRPNYPPPIPPFFNGPSTNHIKHLPRPPPHVFHKAPSYGLGFPYKSFGTLRPTISKEHIRVHNLNTLNNVKGLNSLNTLNSVKSIRPAAGSPSISAAVAPTTSATYLSPTYTPTSYISTSHFTSHTAHIIPSDDNGPIREIPAPNLGPKPHGGDVFDSISNIQTDGFVSSFGKDTNPIPDAFDTPIQTDSYVSSFGKDASLNSKPIPSAFDSVSHDPSNSFVSSYGKDTTVVNVDAIVKDPGVEPTYIKESSGDIVFGKEPTVEIANFDEGSSIDVTNLVKNVGEETHHKQISGYEVTEHHNHLPSNDQIIKGHDGTKLYYAPDPDPSLPVHKVPPTNDPHSTPSNGQNLNNVYIPQIPHGFPYLPGASVTSLSSQELFHLMNGYPTVLSQPVVAFVGQPQPPTSVILSGGSGAGNGAGHGFFQQNGGHSQQGHDISQYLGHPEIHNILHNSDESHHEQESLGSSQSSVVSNNKYKLYAPRNQYPQTQYTKSNSNTNSDIPVNYPTSDINHNYQYEPEASESNIRNSLTVIRQTNEGSLSSETVKELLLEESSDHNMKEAASENVPTIIKLKNIPEVPFYASLPNQQAAEALASLQAAGSIASNYMNKVKITRGDQGLEEEEEEEGGGQTQEKNSNLRNHKTDDVITQADTIKIGGEKTTVDIQQSLPLYETSISAKNLVEDDPENEGEEENGSEISSEGQIQEDLSNLDFKEESNEVFGRRIRPK